MLRSVTLATVVGVIALMPGPASAQGPATDSARVEAARRVLRRDLRNFVTAQESHHSSKRTYARSLREVAELWTPARGVTIVVLTASDRGHSEVAIHQEIPDLICAMFIGDVQSPLGTGTEGEVVCKGP